MKPIYTCHGTQDANISANLIFESLYEGKRVGFDKNNNTIRTAKKGTFADMAVEEKNDLVASFLYFANAGNHAFDLDFKEGEVELNKETLTEFTNIITSPAMHELTLEQGIAYFRNEGRNFLDHVSQEAARAAIEKDPTLTPDQVAQAAMAAREAAIPAAEQTLREKKDLLLAAYGAYDTYIALRKAMDLQPLRFGEEAVAPQTREVHTEEAEKIQILNAAYEAVQAYLSPQTASAPTYLANSRLAQDQFNQDYSICQFFENRGCQTEAELHSLHDSAYRILAHRDELATGFLTPSGKEGKKWPIVPQIPPKLSEEQMAQYEQQGLPIPKQISESKRAKLEAKRAKAIEQREKLVENLAKRVDNVLRTAEGLAQIRLEAGLPICQEHPFATELHQEQREQELEQTVAPLNELPPETPLQTLEREVGVLEMYLNSLRHGINVLRTQDIPNPASLILQLKHQEDQIKEVMVKMNASYDAAIQAGEVPDSIAARMLRIKIAQEELSCASYQKGEPLRAFPLKPSALEVPAPVPKPRTRRPQASQDRPIPAPRRHARAASAGDNVPRAPLTRSASVPQFDAPQELPPKRAASRAAISTAREASNVATGTSSPVRDGQDDFLAALNADNERIVKEQLLERNQVRIAQIQERLRAREFGLRSNPVMQGPLYFERITLEDELQQRMLGDIPSILRANQTLAQQEMNERLRQAEIAHNQAIRAAVQEVMTGAGSATGSATPTSLTSEKANALVEAERARTHDDDRATNLQAAIGRAKAQKGALYVNVDEVIAATTSVPVATVQESDSRPPIPTPKSVVATFVPPPPKVAHQVDEIDEYEAAPAIARPDPFAISSPGDELYRNPLLETNPDLVAQMGQANGEGGEHFEDEDELYSEVRLGPKNHYGKKVLPAQFFDRHTKAPLDDAKLPDKPLFEAVQRRLKTQMQAELLDNARSLGIVAKADAVGYTGINMQALKEELAQLNLGDRPAHRKAMASLVTADRNLLDLQYLQTRGSLQDDDLILKNAFEQELRAATTPKRNQERNVFVSIAEHERAIADQVLRLESRPFLGPMHSQAQRDRLENARYVQSLEQKNPASLKLKNYSLLQDTLEQVERNHGQNLFEQLPSQEIIEPVVTAVAPPVVTAVHVAAPAPTIAQPKVSFVNPIEVGFKRFEQRADARLQNLARIDAQRAQLEKYEREKEYSLESLNLLVTSAHQALAQAQQKLKERVQTTEIAIQTEAPELEEDVIVRTPNAKLLEEIPQGFAQFEERSQIRDQEIAELEERRERFSAIERNIDFAKAQWHLSNIPEPVEQVKPTEVKAQWVAPPIKPAPVPQVSTLTYVWNFLRGATGF